MQRTRTIGYIPYDYFPQEAFFAPYNAGVLTGLSTALMARRHYMLPVPVGIGDDLGAMNELMHSGRIDGVVVRLAEEPPWTDPLLEIIAAAGVPCVCIERAGVARFGFSSVTYDDAGGALTATTYLIAQGHRRIGHLIGDLRQAAARDRLAGYTRALSEAGLPIEDDLLQGRGFQPEDAAEGMQRLLDLAVAPTAVFAANDLLAFSALEVARLRGVRVPDEIAVVGFDDVPLASELVPALTTVRIPFAELGRRAADLILRLTNGSEGAAESETVPLELVRRGTA
jgi:LacI family transcriptional regulator